VAAPRAFGAAVAGVLTFDAILDIGHDLKPLANRIATLGTQAKIIRRLIQPLERGLHARQRGGPFPVALGRYDLIHFSECLRLFFPAHRRRILTRGLDGHVAFIQDFGP